jgi:hypothetical protein
VGSRSVYRGVIRTILAILSAFLALGTGPASQQNTAANRPLPDIKQLLTDVRENQKQIDNLVDQYSCTETEEVHELKCQHGRISNFEFRFSNFESRRRRAGLAAGR